MAYSWIFRVSAEMSRLLNVNPGEKPTPDILSLLVTFISERSTQKIVDHDFFWFTASHSKLQRWRGPLSVLVRAGSQRPWWGRVREQKSRRAVTLPVREVPGCSNAHNVQNTQRSFPRPEIRSKHWLGWALQRIIHHKALARFLNAFSVKAPSGTKPFHESTSCSSFYPSLELTCTSPPAKSFITPSPDHAVSLTSFLSYKEMCAYCWHLYLWSKKCQRWD